MIDEKLFYRYYTEWDYCDILFIESVKVSLAEFQSIKETPCGYWIREICSISGYPYRKKRWISKTSVKRYAYPTKQQAWESYKIRARRRVDYLERDLKRAKAAAYLSMDETKGLSGESINVNAQFRLTA